MIKPNLSNVQNHKAFLGKITTKIRDNAASIFTFEDEKILDVCCGNGLFFLNQNSMHEKIQRFGLDFSQNLLIEARKIFSDNHIQNIKLIAADAFLMPFANNLFDKIFCLNTILNLKSETQIVDLLKELKRISQKNGRINRK